MKKYQSSAMAIFWIVAMALTTSCKKGWLEEKANISQAVPESLKDFQAMLNYSPQLNGGVIPLGEIASDGHYINATAWTASTTPNANNAYTWSQSVPYRGLSSWGNTYSRLFYINLVLDGLQKVEVKSPSEQAEKDHIRAQALFFKAATYFWLAQQYAQPYDNVTSATDQGIAIQENSDFAKNVKRVSVKTTYDLIINYLNESLTALTTIPATPFHGSLPAAHALLARTYISMNNYDLAFVHADKCLQIKKTLLQFKDVPAGRNFMGQFNAEVLFHDEMTTSSLSGFITSACLVDQDLYDSFNDNDLRKTLFLRKTGTNITFCGNYHNNATGLFCGIATDEVYLMRAECYARKGNATEAMKDLNDLLRTRWRVVAGITTYVDQVAANATDALNRILSERKKELMFRGLRWVDLRRLNKLEGPKITLTRAIGGTTYTLEPNSYKYTFPIPIDVLEFSNIPQTTGW